MHKTNVEMNLSLLWGRDIPREYWSEAINAAIHILTWIKMKAIDGRNSYEAYYGKKLTISHFKVFNSHAYEVY